MMKLSSEGYIMEVSSALVDYSPYLRTLRDTKMPIDYVEYEGEKYISVNIDHLSLYTYLRLISGVYEYVPSHILEFMGHDNPLKYPDNFFSVKIYDNWVRDNFYKYELTSDPFFGLEEVSVMQYRVNVIKDLFTNIPEGAYIAGSAAMYMAGVIDDYTDVDMFLLDKNLLTAVGECINEVKEILVTDNSITFKNKRLWTPEPTMYLREPQHLIPNTGPKYIQVILREYSTPSEIVHGFDLDCCGYIYANGRIFRTVRAKYSTLNKMNYFDPKRSSPSYANRLSKYNIRGFDIWIPFIERLTFNEEYFRELSFSILKDRVNDLYKIGSIKPISYELSDEDINLAMELVSGDPIYIMDFLAKSRMMEKYGFDPIISTLLIIYQDHKVKYLMPNDTVSKILISKFKKIYLSNVYNNQVSDYEMMGHVMVDDVNDMDLTWEKSDPMKQLSGTFFPDPIEEDILDWYSKSPYIIVK